MTCALDCDGNRRRARALLTAHLVLLVATTVVLVGRRAGEDSFWYPDASRHAMDGIFVIDALRDGGVLHPYDYGLHYAAKYPAIGVIYYPPLFALVEAGVFCVAGASFGAARATVVLFALVGVLSAWQHGRVARGKGFGLTAALAFVTMPEVVLWGRDAMLEVPVAALVLLSGLFLYLWVNEGRRWAGYACAASLLGAILTKQSAVVMLPVAFFYVLAARRWRLLWSREAIVGYAAAAAILLPYSLFQCRFYLSAVRAVSRGTGAAGLLDPRRWAYLFVHLPRIASWPVVVLAGVGLVAAAATWAARRGNGLGRYLVVWFVVAYVFTVYTMSGSIRYLFLLFPAVAFLAAYGAYAVLPARLGRLPLRAVCVGAVLAHQGWLAWHVEVPSVSDGYQRAAELVAAHPRGETVVFHGHLSGNFIFHARVADPRRRLIVLRTDKLFGQWHRRGPKGNRFTPAVGTVADVQKLLRAHGVGYVVLEPHNSSVATGVKRLLEQAVSQAPWALVSRVPLASHRTPPGNGDILIYENPQAGRATAETIPFWVPISRREFHVTYERVRRLFGGARSGDAPCP